MPMVKKPIEHRGHCRGIAKKLPPILDRAIRSDERARPLVPTHDELEQVFRCRRGKLPHPQVIDDEQLRLSQLFDEDFPITADSSVSQVLEQLVRFSVDDEKTMVPNCSPPDRLRDVALPRTRRP